MRFRLDATDDELREKGERLVETLAKSFFHAHPDLADILEKALPRKEHALKYPLLRELKADARAEYEAMLKRMLADIGAVLAQTGATDDSLQKAGGPYIGPRGGKWADPQMTIPWDSAAGQAHHAASQARDEHAKQQAQSAPTPVPNARPAQVQNAEVPSVPAPQQAQSPVVQKPPQQVQNAKVQNGPAPQQVQNAKVQNQGGSVAASGSSVLGGNASGGQAVTPPTAKDAHAYSVDPAQDVDGDGVGDAARVGIPGRSVLPPPGIPRLPNLTATERQIETKFASTFERDPQGMAKAFYAIAEKSNFIFETDAAKSLLPEWTRPDLPPDEKGKPVHPERAEARATFNTALHQTANAVVKRAFMQRLDEIAKMPEDQRKILVTSGGVAGGKGSALGARPELAQSVAATWDAAGEQNATENPWLMEECEKRGIKPVFLFVAADPEATWPGAVERAKSIGRMVDARAFADSYAHGAKNFAAFHEKHKDRASFVFAKAKKGDPVTFLDAMPPEALAMDSEKLYEKSLAYIESKKAELPPHIYAGATAGKRIWGHAQAPQAGAAA